MSLRMDAGFEHFREAFAETLAKDVEFPVGVFVTVLGVKLTANSIHAKIILSVMPTDKEEAALEILRSFEHEIKNGLAERLRLRRIPRLHYVFDEKSAVAESIETVLNRLKERGEISTDG